MDASRATSRAAATSATAATAATPAVAVVETADAQEQAGTPLRDHEQAQRSLALRERAVGDVPDADLRDHLARLVRRSTARHPTLR